MTMMIKFTPEPSTLLSMDSETRSRIEKELKRLACTTDDSALSILCMVQATSLANDGLSAENLSKRVQNIAKISDFIEGHRSGGIDAASLLNFHLQANLGAVPGRISICGPKIALTPVAAQYLAMAFHELTLNAFEHGALADERGTVQVRWQTVTDPSEPLFVLRWIETSRQPSKQNSESGFGMKFLTEVISRVLEADARLVASTEGYSWNLVAPLSAVAVRKRRYFKQPGR
jgi:two-component sensor histidine kinase